MKETGREDGNLQHKELEALLQRVVQMELQGQKRDEELKILKQIQRVKAMSQQNKKMDEKQQHMDNLQGVVKTGKATEDVYDEMCDFEDIIKERIHYSFELRFK